MFNKMLVLLPITLFFFSIYSYSQVDPNLVLSSNPTYWNFQQIMWQLGYHNRLLSTSIYAVLIIVMFMFYGVIIRRIRQKKLSLKGTIILFAFSIIALLPSYPALSHDVFNYLMNAKIMAVYQSSPYLHAAWDFPSDPWLIFMNNIEVTTPYGYVWTLLGYLTYLTAFGDLQFGMLAFRVLALLSVISISWVIYLSSGKKRLESMALFMFNPLVLTEAIGNMHNDITMMAWLIGGYGLYVILKSKHSKLALIFIGVFWLLSVTTKLVTIILPAVYVGYLLTRRWHKQTDAFGLLALAMLLIMFADGSRRFYPWYLLWSLCLIPFSTSAFIKHMVIAFSLSGCLSYVIYLYTGTYTVESVNQRILLTFAMPILYTGWYMIRTFYRNGVKKEYD